MAVPQMGGVEDAKDPLFGIDDYVDDDFDAYYACYTDGVWIWPQYIIKYIKKYPNTKLDSEFVIHVIKNKNKKIEVSQENCSKIEKEYYKNFGNSLNRLN